MLTNTYWVCLIVGGLYSVVSLVLSNIIDGLDFDFDFDLGDLSLPIKPFTIMVFATVFGGGGLICLMLDVSPMISILVGGGAGVLTAYGLYNLIYVRLRKYEKQTAMEEDAILEKAEVVERILPGGYGKISYVLEGNTLSGAAKEITPGNGIAKGQSVYILDIKDNVYYVCDSLEF